MRLILASGSMRAASRLTLDTSAAASFDVLKRNVSVATFISTAGRAYGGCGGAECGIIPQENRDMDERGHQRR